jgi:hypothetical protein
MRALQRGEESSSLLTQGPITTDACLVQSWGHSRRNNAHRWLWVGSRGACHRARIRATRWLARDDMSRFNFQTAKAMTQRPRGTECARVMHEQCPSKDRGRRESRVPNAPAALRVKIENTQVSHHRFTGIPGLPCAMVLTAYFALSPVTGLSCHRRLADTSAKLDASVGASGPHDFAVRSLVHSSRAPKASIASRPTFVTMANAPLSGGTTGINKTASSKRRSEIFFAEGLDMGIVRQPFDLPVGQISNGATRPPLRRWLR